MIPSLGLCLSNSQYSARIPKLAPYQKTFCIQKSMSAASSRQYCQARKLPHCSRVRHNYGFAELQDENRRQSEKAKSHECRKQSYTEEAELGGSSDIWNITTKFSIPILSCMHSRKFNTKHFTFVLQLCLYAYLL